MSAPLSLRDKQFAFLVGQYGPGLSYADMLQRYLGGGSKSISDLMDAKYPGPGSMNDDYYAALGGSGSLSDKQNANTSGGVAVGSPIDALMATTPFYIGHRGAGDIWPEHTQVGYTGAHDMGMKAIEVSTQISSDGWSFCMHDAGATGLDRTTNGTGDPKTFTRAQLEALVVDVANCGPYWVAQNLKLPDLQTVLTGLLADSTVVFLECKDYSGSAVDTTLSRIQSWFPTKYKTQIIWKSHVSGSYGLGAARAAGMKCWAYIDYPLVAQQVTDALARADYIGIPRYDGGTGLTDAEVDTVISTIGAVKCISWQPIRRSEYAKLLAKGVDGFVSPQGIYALTNTPNRTQDAFASGKWAPGDIPFDSTRNFVLDSGTAWFNNGGVQNPSALLGSFCPVPAICVIEYEMKYDTLPSATSHSGLAFCKVDDQRYQFGLAANPTGGYHIVFRQNGQLQLYKHDPGSGTGTQVGTTLTTPALTTTDWAKVKITISPTEVRIQRTDGTPSAEMITADTSYRGGYIHLSRNHATAESVRFRNIKVT